jgi:hypothetical protein
MHREIEDLPEKRPRSLHANFGKETCWENLQLPWDARPYGALLLSGRKLRFKQGGHGTGGACILSCFDVLLARTVRSVGGRQEARPLILAVQTGVDRQGSLSVLHTKFLGYFVRVCLKFSFGIAQRRAVMPRFCSSRQRSEDEATTGIRPVHKSSMKRTTMNCTDNVVDVT